MKKRIPILLFLTIIIVLFCNIYVYAADTLYWPVPGHTSLSQGYHDGNAIDISDWSIGGANVVAAKSGTVTKAFYCGEQHYGSFGDCYGFGTGIVVLGTDGRAYQYAHMQANSIPSNVYVGATVTAGQILGRVGTTGYSSGNHLHFAISYSQNYWESGPNPEPNAGYITYIYSTLELSASWSNLGAANVGERDARLEGQINFNQNTSVTAAGIRVYNSAGSQIAQKDEGSSVTGAYCKIWYDVNSELGVSLSPGTNYSYKLYATAGGKTFWSDTVYFKTAGQSQYTVSYDANGGSGAPSAQTKTHGQTLTLSSKVPVRTGYTFLYWKASGTNATYYPGGTYTANASATLSAVWEIKTGTVTFDANGGSGAPDNLRLSLQEYSDDEYRLYLAIPEATPTRDGYVFAGWAKTSTAVLGTLFPGTKCWLDPDITLYAVWSAVSGSCGDTANWYISGTTLHITGSGAMDDFSDPPWYGARYSIDTVIVDEGITELGNYSFPAFTSLKNISLPSTLTSIGDYAFYYCSSLTEIDLPSTLTYIGDYAFYDCSSLSKIDIPNSVSRAGREAFVVCTGLTTIVIPEAITELAPYIFMGCDFASVYIHSGVTKISEGAFCNCTIEDLYYTGSTDEWSEITIEGNNAGLSFCRMHCGHSCQYEIQYNADSGSGAPAPENKYYGQTYQISDTVPVRPGYRFLGWSEKKNAVTAEYRPGNYFYGNRDTVFYAVWAQGPEITVNVSGCSVTVELAYAESGSYVFLAQYKSSKMADIQIRTYHGDPLTFDTAAEYDAAKVMVLDKSYRPLCAPVLIE